MSGRGHAGAKTTPVASDESARGLLGRVHREEDRGMTADWLAGLRAWASGSVPKRDAASEPSSTRVYLRPDGSNGLELVVGMSVIQLDEGQIRAIHRVTAEYLTR